MANIETESFDSPDEVRPFAGRGQVKVVNIGGRAITLGTFEPGWKWSNDLKPIAGTDSCQTRHFGYVLSGRMKVVMDGGNELEIGPGDVGLIEPGHDAEVVGDEACVFVDFGDVEHYAEAH